MDACRAWLKAGMSVLIFPEGTYAPDGHLLPFKAGAFVLAIEEQVPVVPVVIRNAGEIMWRASLVARPGTVDVVVLPPVLTTGLGPDDVDDLSDRVRAQFVETLADWPA